MSQRDDSGFKTFVANGAVSQWERVKLNSDGTIDTAGLAEIDIGTAQRDAAAGEFVSVKLRTAAGTHKCLASEALAAGATVYTEASGKVQDTAQATAYIVGTSLEAAAADGDVIEVLYNSHGDTAAS